MADEDWFSANAPPQEPEKDWFAQNAPKVSVAEPPKEGGIVSGVVAGLGRALNPINLVKGALDIGQPSDISNIIRYGKTLGEIVTGTTPDVAIGQNIPELQQQREAVYGKLGGREQAAALTGIGLQLGLTALPFIHGKTLPRAPGSLAEVAEPLIGKAPEAAPIEAEIAATEPVAQPGQFTTTVSATADQAERNLTGQFDELQQQGADLQSRIDSQRMAQSSAPIPEEQIAANREIAPQTEPPSATEPAPEPFPSISQSAETQRRAELQTEQPTPVRQALSLDELRLMRERNELNLQNDIAKRVTGATHPAVDERLGQIDDELTNIANRELQTEGGGEINAQQISEPAPIDGDVLNIPRSEEGTGQVPTDVSSEGVQARGQGEEVQGQEVTPTGEQVQPETAPVPETYVSTTASLSPETSPVTPETPIAEQPTPETGGVSAAALEKRPINVPPPGEVVGWDDGTAQGHEWLDQGGDPQTIIQKFADTKAVSTDDMFRMRAALERLQKNTNVARDALRNDPTNPELIRAANEATLTEQNFTDAYKPMHTFAGANLGSLRGQPPFTDDMATSYTALERRFQENMGREFKPEESTKADQITKKATKDEQVYKDQTSELYKKADTEFKKAPGPNYVPTIEELARALTSGLKEVC